MNKQLKYLLRVSLGPHGNNKKNFEMVLSPMFTFQVHEFRDSQSEGGNLERNTCAKHICLRAVVADDLVDIL